jgi:hypothetical protein
MCDKCTENAWVMSAEDERERIIKLLEDADSACSGWAIALIKGEK